MGSMSLSTIASTDQPRSRGESFSSNTSQSGIHNSIDKDNVNVDTKEQDPEEEGIEIVMENMGVGRQPNGLGSTPSEESFNTSSHSKAYLVKPVLRSLQMAKETV